MSTKVKIDRGNYLFDNRALVALIIPLIIEQLLAILVGMADSIMIANVGEAAVSGVSLVDQIMVLVIQVFSALATGGAVVTGQYMGQKNRKKACDSAMQMVWFITICSVVITVGIYGGKYWILHGVFGQIEKDVMGYANTYLLIVTASIPFIALYNCGAAVFRTMGNSEISMRVSIIMNVINVCGNALLIYGFHRGAEGVAIPTLVSRIVAAVIITVMLVNEKYPVHIKRTLHYRLDWSMVKRILSIGIPNGLENSMFQLGKIIVLSLVSTFGTHAIAANAVGNAVSLFSILPGMAISLAITTVISRCVGAGDYEQVKYYIRKLILITHVGMLVSVGLVFLAMPWIVRAYHLSELTAQVTRQILYFHGICTIFFWPGSFSLPAAFRASGDARACMIISILSMWIFRIIFSYILGKYMGMGVFGVWVAMIIDWVFRVICYYIRYASGKWKKAAIV
ncbi:MAG: MATE family efflux transporter, partial [Eubacteriales bacterium]|nr:MATE family efflux transporter [Eubacteriales bacterium]